MSQFDDTELTDWDGYKTGVRHQVHDMPDPMASGGDVKEPPCECASGSVDVSQLPQQPMAIMPTVPDEPLLWVWRSAISGPRTWNIRSLLECVSDQHSLKLTAWNIHAGFLRHMVAFKVEGALDDIERFKYHLADIQAAQNG